MTTPPPKPVYTNQPNYMFPDLQGLPDEFRRLAAEALEISQYSGNKMMTRFRYEGKELAFRQAAQMLEERLDG